MAFKLHKEGKVIIPVSLLLIGALVAGGFWFGPLPGYLLLASGVGMTFLIINFFRNPQIAIVVGEDHVVSPCDGRVVVIEEIEDKVYFNGPRLQVSIFMSPLNVHVNRNPISGTIRYFKYLPGQYLMAFNPKSSQLNEQTYVVAENDRWAIGYKQIAGFLARRIKWYINENDQVAQGEEYGFIRFGSRIDLLLPTEAKVEVKLGDKVKAGRTVIARAE